MHSREFVPARVIVAVLGLWLFHGLLYAQQDTGTIVGGVYDATGAVVAGATVVVTNVLTNVKVTVTTDSNGNFIATPLRIGTYQVEKEVSGFKATVRTEIVLRVQDRL